MRPHALALLLPVLLVLSSEVARADRFQRAENNFKTNCIGCHTLGWGAAPPNERGKVDLTLVASRLDEARLRTVLEDPAGAGGAPDCRHQALERVQIDDLIAFLRLHGSPEAPRQVVPPRSRMRKPSDPPVRPAGQRTGARSTGKGPAQGGTGTTATQVTP